MIVQWNTHYVRTTVRQPVQNFWHRYYTSSAVGGPYWTQQGEVFVAGAAQAEVFVAGDAQAEVHIATVVAGEVSS